MKCEFFTNTDPVGLDGQISTWLGKLELDFPEHEIKWIKQSVVPPDVILPDDIQEEIMRKGHSHNLERQALILISIWYEINELPDCPGKIKKKEKKKCTPLV